MRISENIFEDVNINILIFGPEYFILICPRMVEVMHERKT